MTKEELFKQLDLHTDNLQTLTVALNKINEITDDIEVSQIILDALSVVNGRQRSYLSNYLDNHSGAM
jgi:hypothetical protein